MNVKRILTFLMVLCSLFAFLPSPGIAADNDKDPSIYFRPSVRFGTDDRTLYIMDFFIPLHRGNKDILFFEPRFTPSDTDGGETNLGIGYRHLLFNDKLVLGGNVFYDTRRTGWGTYWDQVGFGFEAMADLNKYLALTARFNYYVPLTDPKVTGGTAYYGGGYYFEDLGIYTGGTGNIRVEEALEGFDGELGFRVPYVSDYLETWVYGGGYHYHGDYVGDVDGWSARLEVIPTDFLRLNYEYREDKTNGGEHHGEVAFEVPFSIENLAAGKNPFAGFGKHIGGSRDIKTRMVESVHRDIDIRVIDVGTVAGSGTKGTEVEAVVFVSENAPNISGTPDGSFAHPFATVAAAVAAIESGGAYAGITTIHVMNDSGSLTINGGLVDFASLVIWGSGLPHPTYGYIQNQYLGNPDIYDLNVTADNVEVYGNTFVGTTGMTTSGTGTYVHDNTFTATTGIHTTGGTSTITGNTFTGGGYGILSDGGTVAVTDNEFLADVYGIWINYGTYTITNNTIGTAANPITNTGIYAGGSDASLDGVSGNTIVVTGTGSDAYGICLNNLVTSFILADNDITVTNTGGNAYGIYGYSDSGDIYGSITGGTITASGIRGVGIYLAAPGAIGDSGSPFTVSGSTINATSTTDYAAGFIASADGGDVYALLTDNIITATSSGYIANGINEFASGSLGGGIYGGSVTASGLVAEGAYLCGGDTIGSSTNPYTISGVTFDVTSTFPTYTYGVRYLSDGYLYTSISGSSITVNNAAGLAIGVYGYGYDGDYGSIDNSTITAIGVEAHGVELRSNGSIGSSSDPFTISGTTITTTGSGGNACGLYEFSNNGDIFGSITGGGITGTSTGGNAWGIYLEADAGSIGGSTSPFTITGVTINATGTGGAYGVYEHAYDTLYGRISNGVDITASGLGAYGIYLLADTGPIGSSGSPFTISGVSIGSTATEINRNAYGVYMESAGGDIYAVIEYPYITATAGNAYAYGVYENAAGDIYGEIHSGTIIARGENQLYGVRLSAGGSIGSSGNCFTISDATIEATGTGAGSAKYAAGVYLGAYGNIYSQIEDNYITAGESSGGVNAYGVYESALGTIYGEISDGTITATGWVSSGVRLDTYGSIGDSTNPFTISDVTITATASDKEAMGVEIRGMSYGDMYTAITDSTITATSENSFAYDVYGSTSGNLHTTITDSYITATSENHTAYGIYEWAGGSISGGIWGGRITVNGDDGAIGVYLSSSGSIGSSTSPFTVSSVTINATGTGNTCGLSFESGDDLYSFIDGNVITATSVSGFAYGASEHASDDIRGEFYSGRITASGLGAYGIYLVSDTGSIGSSSDMFEISRTRVTSTATGYYDAYGVYMESAGGNIYAAIKNANITAAQGNIYAYGIFETAQGTIYGEISGGTITATGVVTDGVWLDADGSLGDSTNPFTISGATITATGTTAGTYVPATGISISSDSGGDLYAAITGNTITATSGGAVANGVFELTNGNLDTTITDNTITATSGGFHARGIYEWADGSISGGISGGSITVSGGDSATAVTLNSSGSIGSSTSPFTVSGVTANITSDVARYFMYLDGSGSGTSAITWSGNAYAPYGGSAVWSGNYDTTGFVTNGPLYLDGITDAEVTP